MEAMEDNPMYKVYEDLQKPQGKGNQSEKENTFKDSRNTNNGDAIEDSGDGNEENGDRIKDNGDVNVDNGDLEDRTLDREKCNEDTADGQGDTTEDNRVTPEESVSVHSENTHDLCEAKGDDKTVDEESVKEYRGPVTVRIVVDEDEPVYQDSSDLYQDTEVNYDIEHVEGHKRGPITHSLSLPEQGQEGCSQHTLTVPVQGHDRYSQHRLSVPLLTSDLSDTEITLNLHKEKPPKKKLPKKLSALSLFSSNLKKPYKSELSKSESHLPVDSIKSHGNMGSTSDGGEDTLGQVKPRPARRSKVRRTVTQNWHKSHLKQMTKAVEMQLSPSSYGTLSKAQLARFLHKGSGQLRQISGYLRKPIHALQLHTTKINKDTLHESVSEPFNR